MHEREQLIDQHHAEIVRFIENLDQSGLSRDVSLAAIEVVEATDYLESGEDLVDKEVIPLHWRHVERDARVAAGS